MRMCVGVLCVCLCLFMCVSVCVFVRVSESFVVVFVRL